MKRLLLGCLILGVMGLVSGDVVAFKNGDRLTGTLLRMVDGNLVFKAAVIGEVTVPAAEIKSLTTDEAIELHFKDGTVIKSKVSTDAQGNLTFDKTDVVAAQQFKLDDLMVINPPPKPKVKWKGSLTGGLTSTHGNTFAQSGSIDFNAGLRREKDRTSVNGRYLVSRTKDDDGDKKTTEESLTLGGKYDYFFSKKMYGFLSGSFKKDHVADLDRRLIGGLGAGYQWIESDEANFSTDVGLSIVHEKYVRRVLEFDSGTSTMVDMGEREISTSDDLTILLGYHYDRIIREGIDFVHNLTYYPSVTGTISDYYLTTDAEIRFKMTDNMYSSFKVVLDYDSTPGKDIGSTDTKYILGVGINF